MKGCRTRSNLRKDGLEEAERALFDSEDWEPKDHGTECYREEGRLNEHCAARDLQRRRKQDE